MERVGRAKIVSEKYLIVGLGNPEKKYFHTRHNFGFLVLEQLAQECSLKWSKSLSVNGMTAECTIEDCSCVLLMPLTYMNLSGAAVKKIVEKKGIAPERILVICDDLSLEFGQIRLRPNGSDGGHNGLKSIIEHLGTKNFARLRLGIGRPADLSMTVAYVLGEFTKAERKSLPEALSKACQCCQTWLKEGPQKAMNDFNSVQGRPKAGPG